MTSADRSIIVERVVDRCVASFWEDGEGGPGFLVGVERGVMSTLGTVILFRWLVGWLG